MSRVNYALPRTGLPAAVSFRKWVAAALDSRIREADLAIRIVGTKEGRALNRHYRGKDYATNVLSFPAELPEGLPEGVKLPLLGDLVICAPVVAREAQRTEEAAGRPLRPPHRARRAAPARLGPRGRRATPSAWSSSSARSWPSWASTTPTPRG